MGSRATRPQSGQAIRPVARSRQQATRLATHRIVSGRRANANEWFRLDDELIRVLFEEGWIVARARVAPTLGTMFGRALDAIFATWRLERLPKLQ